MKFVSLILSAGNSTRFGSPKALAEIHGLPLLHQWVKLLQKCGATEHFVVINSQSGAEIKKAITESMATHLGLTKPITWVEQPDTTLPQFSSIQKGIQAIVDNQIPGNNLDGVILTPVDVVPPAETTVDAIIAAFHPGASQGFLAGRPIYQQKRGHPVFLTTRILKEILVLNPQSNRLDELLKGHGQHVLEIPVSDDRVITNVNESSQLPK